MSHQDFAVRKDGALMRFVSDGTKAGVFAQDGTMEPLLLVSAGNSMRSPEVTDLNGNPVKLSRVAKPCSCRGGVWKSRPSALVAQL